jgi:hypothetical protein
MAELESEWRRQETARERTMATQKKQITGLEKQLRSALLDVEQQEKRLRSAEEELNLRRHKMESDLEQNKQEVLVTVRRLREQHAHQLDMNKRMIEDLRKQNTVLRAQTSAADNR